MRPTSRLCGIKGIFPLIKKECPQAIYYPHRFDDLSGYRIAVDATLLVQRFHFSDDDHPARHLIGFHRLISSLRASNVFPIFVFDHLTSRITAKSRETEKRREARSRVRARMKMELRRAWRLKVLNQTLQRLESIEGRDKRKVAELLQQWSQKSTSSDVSSTTWLDDLDKSITTAVPTSSDEWASFRLRLDELREEDPSAWAADQELNMAATGPTQPRSSRMDVSISDQATEIVEEPEDVEQWQTIYEEQTSSAYAIASRIDLLRQDFQRLHTDTQSASSSKPPHPVTPIQAEMNAVEEQLYNRLASGIDTGSDRLDKSGSLPWSIVERQMDESLRKAQEVAIPQATQAVQDTSDAVAVAEEAMIPPSVPSEDVAVPQDTQALQETSGAEVAAEEAVDAPPSVPSPSPVTLDSAELPTAPVPAPVVPHPSEAALDEHRQRQLALETITARNASLQKSYGRSSAPLSSTVFDDAATLCSLLQVPVLWTGSGSPYGGAKGEAEALAASLVNLGQADAVATEDSDVLLAEVPLIRHLTGTKKPLELVDSQLARRCLFPVKMPLAGPTKVKKSSSATTDEVDSTPLSAEEQAKMEETEALDACSRADKLSRYAMLDFALLCGTDYNRTIPGLAGRGALKLLREHGSIRAMLKALNSPMVTAPVKDASASGDTKGQSSITTTAAPVMSKATPPFTPKYQPPEGLSWKDYGAELSRARAIFNNPPDATRALRLAGIQSSEHQKVADAALKDGQGDELVDEAVTPAEATLKIAPRPRVSILDYLRSKATATVAASTPVESPSSIDGSKTSSHHPPQLFAVPDFDRQAVRAFLKSKGLGKGREPAAVEGDVRSWSLESGEMMGHDQVTARQDEEQQQQPKQSSVGFGRVLGGEISGGATFAFDYQQQPQHEQQRKTV